jgi:hypothetical protein
VQVLVGVEREPVDDLERCLGSIGLCHRHGEIQLDHRRAGEPGEFAVERRDLRPVDLVVRLKRPDRSLHDVRAAPTERERAVQQRTAFPDLGRVPECAILVLEQHEVLPGDPRLTPRVVEQHQRKESVHLGFVGHELPNNTPEADRLSR